MKEKEVLRVLERFYCGEIEADEAAEALKPAAGWDPEEPELPKRLRLNQYATSEVFAAIVRGDVADEGTLPLLAAVMRGWLKPASRLPVLEAMVAAYNREREEEEFEAQAGPALTADIEKLCREAIDREVQKGVLQERARCLGVFDWLLSVIPRGWDFVRRYTEAARRKLESGEVPRPAGADDLPHDGDCGLCGKSPSRCGCDDAPERCEWPGCNLPALCRSGNFQDRPVCAEHFRVTNGDTGESASFQEHLRFGTSGLVTDDRGLGWRALTPAEATEAERRWRAEPKLRLWKNMSANLLETERKVRERLREERDTAKNDIKLFRQELDGCYETMKRVTRQREEAVGDATRAEAERNHYRNEALDLGNRISRAKGVVATAWGEAWGRAVAGDRSGTIGLLYNILTGKET